MPPKRLARWLASSTALPSPGSGRRKSGSVVVPAWRSAIAAAPAALFFQRAEIRSYKPTSPVGEKTMKATNSRPK